MIARIAEVAGGWVSEELGMQAVGEDLLWDVVPCGHPAVPPPHLALIVFVSLPSHARIGQRITNAMIMDMAAVAEGAVRAAAQQTLAVALENRRRELAEARAAGNGHGTPSPGLVPPGRGPGLEWPPR